MNRSKIGKKSKSKGQRGERQVAKLLSEATGLEFSRTPLSGGWASARTRDQVNAHGDLVCSDPDFPWSVEVKNCEGWSFEQLLTAPKSQLHEYWHQTVTQTPEGKRPLLVFTRNHAPWFCMGHLDLPGLRFEDRTICLFSVFLETLK